MRVFAIAVLALAVNAVRGDTWRTVWTNRAAQLDVDMKSLDIRITDLSNDQATTFIAGNLYRPVQLKRLDYEIECDDTLLYGPTCREFETLVAYVLS